MLFRAGVGHRRDDVLGAQCLEVLDGNRSSVAAMLGGNPRIAQPLSTFHDVTGEATVLHDVDPVRAVRRQVGPQRLSGHVQRLASGRLDHRGPRLAVADRDLDELVGGVGGES